MNATMTATPITTFAQPNASILTKDQFLQARADFRTFVNSPDNRPTFKLPHGQPDNERLPGSIQFFHFAFFAILLNRDIKKVSHDIKAFSYTNMISSLKFGDYNKQLSLLFTSLSPGLIDSLINRYEKW